MPSDDVVNVSHPVTPKWHECRELCAKGMLWNFAGSTHQHPWGGGSGPLSLRDLRSIVYSCNSDAH